MKESNCLLLVLTHFCQLIQQSVFNFVISQNQKTICLLIHLFAWSLTDCFWTQTNKSCPRCFLFFLAYSDEFTHTTLDISCLSKASCSNYIIRIELLARSDKSCWEANFWFTIRGKRHFRFFLTQVLSLKAKFPICIRAMPIHCILKNSKCVCFVLISMDWVPLSAICAGHNCLPTKHYIISDEITGQRLIVSQLPFCL